MGPLRGDGNQVFGSLKLVFLYVEKMGPLRGDGNLLHIHPLHYEHYQVEKMGPLRGDGNHLICSFNKLKFLVEKMGPLRGDGNGWQRHIIQILFMGREDGSPSWGRKLCATVSRALI